MLELISELFLQPPLVPAGVTLGPKEHRPLIVIHSNNVPATAREVHTHL
jgi:hypothetical protein